MRKTVTITTCFIALILMSFAVTKDERRYKNLKVLPKNITKEQMDSVMKHFTGSLGVKCNFCHVFNQEQKAMDFASDANEHKGVARYMMKMTTKLNKKYFEVKDSKSLGAKYEVTCYTCHNGKENPGTKPPAPPAQQRAPQDSARRQ
jgi:hypothetical protein